MIFFYALANCIKQTAPWPSGKAELCKSSIHQFESDRRLFDGIDRRVGSQQHSPNVASKCGYRLFRRTSLYYLRSCILILTVFFGFAYSALAQDNSSDNYTKRAKINLGRQINSPFSELAPIISPNGKLLFFTMGRDHPSNLGEDHLQDCYVSHRAQNGSWSAPKNLGLPINSVGNDAISGVSPDGRTLFIKNFIYNPTNGYCFARKDTNGRWNINPITILEYSNSSHLSSQSISVNGDFIVISAERADGYGGLDLYVSRVKDRSKNLYGPLENLGLVLNTNSDEIAPFLAADSKTLYFSSRGRGGFGDADVFMTKRLDDSWVNWSAPKNLGKDINTEGMDAYYSVPASGDVAFFSSSNGNNHLDLYKILLNTDEQPDPVMLLQGEVMNRQGVMIHGSVAITDIQDNINICNSESSEDLGDFSLVLPTGKRYRLSVSAPGYLPFSSEIDLSQTQQFADTTITVILDSVTIGSVATIEDIYFDFNKATLKSESFFSLDKLAELLHSNEHWVVRIEGYTDSIGSAEFNKVLSHDRAQSVVSYLISKGIVSERLQAEGFGAASPVADNSTEDGRRKNRRVELRLIRFSEK